MNVKANHPLPEDALDDRQGFVGTAGSGKTYNAGSAVERILDHCGRVVIPDPLGVWWGLRLRADGETPSPYRVVIFGGPHGDLPLNEHAGALLGETVATMQESCILDLSDLGTKAAERRFMLAFLSAFYRHAAGEPVHVIFDEADMWAPERMLDKEGEAAKLKGMMETIVRRGRVKGFIPWLITQRPAVLSKDVLSQVDGLVSFKLTSSQDRDALAGWVEGQADKEEWKRIRAELPTLERGTGVVWLPSRGVLRQAGFPAKRTFDSSRTPKRGETVRTAALKPIDLGALKERLAGVAAEAKENDPKALRARIREMEKQLAATPAAVSQDALDEAYGHGHTAGFTEGRQEGYRDGYAAAWDEAVDRFTKARECAGIALAALKDIQKPAHVAQRIEPRASNPKVAGSSPAVRSTPSAGPGEKMSGAERKILTALAQYPQGRSKRQVAILTGYAINGGGFNNALSSLRTKAWMEGRGDPLRITDAGVTALGEYHPLPTGPDLLAHWLGQLEKAPRAILSTLADVWPDTLTKEEIAARTGYEPNGGGFNNALSRLRTLELIEGRGELRASEDLF